MKKAISFIFILVSFLLIFSFRESRKLLTAEPEEGYTYNKYQTAFDKQFALVKIPDNLDFAGEKVPTHQLQVRQKFSDEYVNNSYWLLPSLLSNPEMSRIYSKALSILKEKRIPQDFIYLLMAESGLKNSVSNKGAAGVWQLMPESARGLGLEVDDNVDERYDYVKSTYAACEYLKQAYNEFGDWTLTAASYNMGIGGISSRIGDDTTKTFYDIYVKHETSRYIYKILAIKVVMSNPKKYDYYLLKNNNQYPITMVKVDTDINNLQLFAESLGYDIFTLKKYNPWLVSNRLPMTEGKTYTLEFPAIIKEAEAVASPLSPDTENMNSIRKFLFHEE